MIKAIETVYKGYRFRSRLEARWAVYFDAMNIEWEYEKEGYDLGELGWYLPDFWLPQSRLWAEVKPVKFSEIELSKCIKLATETKSDVLVLEGLPEARLYFTVFCGGIYGLFNHSEKHGLWNSSIVAMSIGEMTGGTYERIVSEAEYIQRLRLLDTDGETYPDENTEDPYSPFYRNSDGQLCEEKYWCEELPFGEWNNENKQFYTRMIQEETAKGLIAARSARFEHGESPFSK